VQSSISLSIFREFVSALEGNVVKITDAKFGGLQRLYEALKEVEDGDTCGQIAALKEKR
jgi:hypothetical protein